MPKTVNTPREELICGKLDALIQAILDEDKFLCIDLVGYIRDDAERMEQKLILRKHEVKELSALANKV